jgi:hypothetical protein
MDDGGQLPQFQRARALISGFGKELSLVRMRAASHSGRLANVHFFYTLQTYVVLNICGAPSSVQISLVRKNRNGGRQISSLRLYCGFVSRGLRFFQ